MTGNFDPALGASNARLALGDIVAGREIYDKGWSNFSSELASVAADEPTGRIIYSSFGEAGIILPIHEYYADNQARIRGTLASLKMSYAIFGDSPDDDFTGAVSENKKQRDVIADWEQQHTQFKPGYLERIFYGRNRPDSAASYVTLLTLHKAGAEVLSDNQTDKMLVSSMYTRMVKTLYTSRGAREHLLRGTVYFGGPIRSSKERYPQPQWGITPAALYGMSLETGRQRMYGLGEKGAHFVGKLLDHIVVT